MDEKERIERRKMRRITGTMLLMVAICYLVVAIIRKDYETPLTMFVWFGFGWFTGRNRKSF